MELHDLEPIQFGPNDDDRVKDMFEKVFIVEYGRQKDRDIGIGGAINGANYCASEVAKIYRKWLKEQAS